MKNRRNSLVGDGTNNLAKILCRKENKELIETIERYWIASWIAIRDVQEDIVETLSAAKEGGERQSLCNR